MGRLPPLERALAVVDTSIDLFVADPDVWRPVVTRLTPGLRHQPARLQIDALDQARVAGLLRADADTTALGTQVLVAYTGALFLWAGGELTAAEFDGGGRDDELAGLYRHLDGPVTRVRIEKGRTAWLVTGYDEVRTVLADPRFSRARAVAAGVGAPGAADTAGSLDGDILDLDGAEHAHLRKPVIAVFTPRRVERLRPGIAAIAAELLAAVDDDDTFDVVTRYAFPVPLRVLCRLLGVPFADRERFRGWADALLSTTAYTTQEKAAAIEGLTAYLQELVERRRTEPASDLLSDLVHLPAGTASTDPEIVGLAAAILVAGHETTANQIANMTYLALLRPEVAAGLRGDEPGAWIEELLRWIALGSTVGFPRVAADDVVLGGHRIRAGDVVLPELFAANHDPRTFADPDTVDPHRASRPHLAFGHGIHHCLGAALARAGLQVAVPALLRAFPGPRPAEPIGGVAWRTGQLVRGPRRLLVTTR
jgi:cytochrome P450